jgi:hypothetical protein
VVCRYEFGNSAEAERRLFWMGRLFYWLIDPMHGPPDALGVNGPDSGAIPGCRWHHDEQTNMPGGWEAFEKKYGFSREKEAAAHWELFRLVGAE